jgi:hypothetical protein
VPKLRSPVLAVLMALLFILPAPAVDAGLRVEEVPGAAATATLAPVVTLAKTQMPQIEQRYQLTGSFSFSASHIAIRETITLVNHGSDFSFNTVDLSFIPRYLSSVGRAGYHNSFGQITVDGAAVASSWIRSASLLISLGKSIASGQRVTIVVPFSEYVGGDTGVFGARLSKLRNILALGNWFPILSIDHPVGTIGDPFITWNAASIDVDLRLADAARSSLPVGAVVASGDPVSASGTHWVFHAVNVRDFAVTISPYYASCSTKAANAVGTMIRARATASASYSAAANCSAMLAKASAAFAKYNSYFGQYTYKSFTVAESGGTSESMEYPTLIMMSYDKIRDGWTVYHETAHQWFYGMLGDDQLNEPWTDEAWASFAAFYFWNGSMRSACSSVNVNSGVSAFSAWSGCNQYLETVYYRGARMIDSMRSAMGSTAFFSAIRRYVNGYRYRLISGYALLRYLDSQTTARLDHIYCPATSYC